MTRKEFIKTGSAAATAAGLSGCLTATAGAGAVIAAKTLSRKIVHNSSSGSGGGFRSGGGGFRSGGGFHGGGGFGGGGFHGGGGGGFHGGGGGGFHGGGGGHGF